MNIAIFCDMAQRGQYLDGGYGRMCHPHLHPEDEGDMFRRNISSYAGYTKLYQRLW
jgi:hypothetical protein